MRSRVAMHSTGLLLLLLVLRVDLSWLLLVNGDCARSSHHTRHRLLLHLWTCCCCYCCCWGTSTREVKLRRRGRHRRLWLSLLLLLMGVCSDPGRSSCLSLWKARWRRLLPC